MRKRIGFVSNSYFDRCYSRENVIDIVLSGLFGELGARYNVESADFAGQAFAKKFRLAGKDRLSV